MKARTTTTGRAVLIGTTAAALVLAGCTGGTDDPEPTVTVTETVSPPDDGASPDPTPTDEPDGTPAAPDESPGPTESPGPDTGPLPDEGGTEDDAPFPADASRDTQQVGGDAFLSPVDLRFGVHEGYDRLVLDLTGEGTPGWTAEYVEDPTQQAAGGPVYLEGDAYLMVLVRGVVYPTEEGAEPFEGPRRITPSRGDVIQDVVYGSLFEGQQEIFIGLSSRQPFRVFSLEDPTRVVIDVQHP